MSVYQGSYKSLIARAKKVLTSAGIPWSRTTGRYHPFASTKRSTKGVRVVRIGASTTVMLVAGGFNWSRLDERREETALKARALEALRAAGLAFDGRGWLEARFQ